MLPVARIGDMHPCPMQTSGMLDNNGFTSIEGIDEGIRKITFPKIDKDAWEKV